MRLPEIKQSRIGFKVVPRNRRLPLRSLLIERLKPSQGIALANVFCGQLPRPSTPVCHGGILSGNLPLASQCVPAADSLADFCAPDVISARLCLPRRAAIFLIPFWRRLCEPQLPCGKSAPLYLRANCILLERDR